MMLNITVIQGAQGCGKTTRMRQEALDNPDRYVFSCPSIALIREQVDWLKANAPLVRVCEAHSDSPGRMGVRDKIQLAKSEIDRTQAPHAILFITHEALMGYDLSDFQGWHIRVDEAPASLQSGRIKAKISKSFIADKLRLDVTLGHWSHYVADPLKWTETARDSMAKNASDFFKQAGRLTGIFIDETALAENDEYVWFSFWSPTYLKAFASITISASGYFTSLGYKAADQFYGHQCTFTSQIIITPRTEQPAIEIIYMTDSHKGSSSFWDKSEGRKCLVEVCDYMVKASPDLGFWSGNEVAYRLMEHRLGGEYISPKAMGLNKFREKKSCALIYSSKATHDDRAIIEALDVTQADILADREMEDIRQFVMRGAIRNPDYAGPYLIYLYEKIQAEQLQSHLIANGFIHISVAQALVPHTARYVRKDCFKRELSTADKKSRRREQNRINQQVSRKRKSQKVAQP